jgi:hypothetical protein
LLLKIREIALAGVYGRETTWQHAGAAWGHEVLEKPQPKAGFARQANARSGNHTAMRIENVR